MLLQCIPVIVAGILEGPLVGGLVGLIFGLSSMMNALMRPTPVSFIFLNPLIAVVPRILIGIVAAYCYKSLKNKDNKSIREIYYIYMDFGCRIFDWSFDKKSQRAT